MRLRLTAGGMLCGLLSVHCISAQGPDPNLLREVTAVRVAVARNNVALQQYTWTEHTEVLVKGKVKSSSDVTCRYNSAGELTKAPIGEATEKEKKSPSATSNRPVVRKKADMQDYIQRAISLIHTYVPPKPDQILHLLQNGSAFLGQSDTGKSEIRFKNYYQDGDALVFTADPVSKALLRASISSTLGSPKDPVTLEAAFETLPDGVNHLASTTLDAKAKKVQVRTRNINYQKVAN
jgi:hypothetical protein